MRKSNYYTGAKVASARGRAFLMMVGNTSLKASGCRSFAGLQGCGLQCRSLVSLDKDKDNIPCRANSVGSSLNCATSPGEKASKWAKGYSSSIRVLSTKG